MNATALAAHSERVVSIQLTRRHVRIGWQVLQYCQLARALRHTNWLGARLGRNQ